MKAWEVRPARAASRRSEDARGALSDAQGALSNVRLVDFAIYEAVSSAIL
jgi:hypothetical protein